MSEKIKYGVVGAGYLGSFHIQQILSLANVELIGFYDTNRVTSQKTSSLYGIQKFASVSSLLGACQAISIVTPTQTHFNIAHKALSSGCSVFIEKPITSTVDQAKKLICLANKLNLKIQVGHIERFNPAYTAFVSFSPKPLFVESHRLAPFNVRGSDVAVILDLMIHDIDLLHHFIDSDIINIQANGASVVC